LPVTNELPSLNHSHVTNDSEREATKIILLGTESAGKSTVLTQLRNAFKNTPTVNERLNSIFFIHHYMLERKNIGKDHSKSCGNIERRFEFGNPTSKTFQNCSEHWKEDPMFTSISYYIENIHCLTQPAYVPTDLDLLYLQTPTYGIHKTAFSTNGGNFEVYDVGGGEIERRKWIHCFENANIVYYVAALSDFDQYTTKNGKRYNRLAESLQLFSEILQNEHLSQCHIILFLNKIDVFEQKILQTDIASIPEFADFRGNCHDARTGVKYFTYLFLKQLETPSQKIIGHVICALDSERMTQIFTEGWQNTT